MPSAGKVFDAIAGEWNEYRAEPVPILPRFVRLMPKNAVALDAGCGNARNGIAIARKARMVFGVDASKKMLEFGKARVREKGLGNVRLLKADFLALPFRNAFFDAAFYIASLHHLTKKREQRKAFSEMARVLKPGGRAFATVWNKAQKKFWDKKSADFVSWRLRDGSLIKRPHYFFEETELRELAEAAGLGVERLFYEKKGLEVSKSEGRNLCAVFRK